MTLPSTITLLGHASILIEHGQDRLVLDPMLRRRLLWLKREDEAVFDFEKLWQTQTVIITSPRFGRFDHHSLKFFKQHVARIIAPEGMIKLLSKHFHFSLEKPVESESLTAGSFTIIPHAVPHKSWRGLRRHEHSWHYLIKTPEKTFFYSSDMAFDRRFYAQIAAGHKIDVAILPIDFVSLPGTNKSQFLTPEDAVLAAQELKATTIIPCQFGSFGKQGPTMLDRFQVELTRQGLAEKARILKPGERVEL